MGRNLWSYLTQNRANPKARPGCSGPHLVKVWVHPRLENSLFLHLHTGATLLLWGRIFFLMADQGFLCWSLCLWPFVLSLCLWEKPGWLNYSPYEVVAGGYRILPAFLSPSWTNPTHSASHSMLCAPALFRRKKKNSFSFIRYSREWQECELFLK